MKQEQFKELLRSQQGELNAVLMYQRLITISHIREKTFV